MRRVGVIGVAIILLALLLVGCTQTTNQSLKQRQLTLGLMPDIGMFPLLVAQEEGLFAEENVEVEFLVFRSAKERDAALQSGQLNGTMSDLLAVYFLNNSGVRVKATSSTESRFLLLAAKDSKIQSVADLKETKIGLSANTVIEYVVDTILDEEEIAPKKMSVPQVPVRMELLRSGQIQVAALPDPLATVLTKSGSRVLADTWQQKMNPAVLIFTEKTLQEQPGAVADLYKAYDRGVQLINENPEKYRKLLLEQGGFPESVIDEIEIPTFTKAELPSEEEVSQIMSWVKKKGLEEKRYTYDDLVQNGIFK